MAKSYISIRSSKGIVYEGEGAVYEGDWRMRLNKEILTEPWYSLMEIRKISEDKLMVSQFTAYKEDFYFLDNILKNTKEKI